MRSDDRLSTGEACSEHDGLCVPHDMPICENCGYPASQHWGPENPLGCPPRPWRTAKAVLDVIANAKTTYFLATSSDGYGHNEPLPRREAAQAVLDALTEAGYVVVPAMTERKS